MRPTYATVLILLFSAFLTACCTKKDCRTIEDLSEIQFVNFQASELDSMVIETYDAVLSIRLDSTFRSATVVGSYMAISFANEFDREKSYRIINLSSGQVDTLSQFLTKREKCNTCFPSKAKGNVTVLDSYVVNSDTFYGELLSVAKRD